MPTLCLQHVHKRSQGRLVLDDITLNVNAGELLVILGPEGSGKSALLNVIAGIEPIDRGAIYKDGHFIAHLEPKQRDMAMVFQNSALYPHKTVFANLAFGLCVRRCPKSEIKRRVWEVAQKLNIVHVLDRKPLHLSDAERLRAALGSALARHPQIYLLDNPLCHLDARLRCRFQTELKMLQKDLGATMMWVTHDQYEAMNLADRIAIMDRGRIVQCATPDVIYNRPASTFVASFFGNPSMNLLPAHLDTDRGFIRLNDGVPFPLLRSAETLPEQCLLGFRPEHIRSDRADGLPFLGRVILLEPCGSDTYALIDCCGFGIKGRFPINQVTPGQDIRLSVDFKDLHLFNAHSGKRIEPSPFYA